MDRWRGRVAVVTGASAGIGAELVRRLVGHGMTVVGCARAVDRIQAIGAELAGSSGKLIAIKCDVSKEEDILSLFERVRAELGTVDVCVNNAGMSTPVSILNGSSAEWQQIFDVNVKGVRECTREAVKLMREKGVNDGHIINVNSMSGHRATDKREQAAYIMSKHALTAMTELTRREIRDLDCRIRVTQISPGMVRTEFQGRYQGDMKAAEEKYDSLDTVLAAGDVVDAIEYALAAPEHVQIHDVLMRPTTQKF